MRQTELTQDPADRDRWVLPGVGSFLRTGRVSRAATAEAGGRSWRIVRYGFVFRTGFRASDATGTVVGEVRHPMMGHSEVLRWAGRELTLRPHEPHGDALLDGDRRLALMVPKQAGKRPLDVVIDDPAADPGLLLFVAFIVQAHADDSSFSNDPYTQPG